MRDTNTRDVLETMIEDSLTHGGYTFLKKTKMSNRLGGGNFKADFFAQKGEQNIVVTAKWQESSGSAENKIPYDYMCLADVILKEQELTKGYLVLGGDGWSKSNFFLNELRNWVNCDVDVTVILLSSFVVNARLGRL